ncbi:MAG: exosortase system-associated protein, TIGR04073 family [Mariprofundaceae bacterium]|nr:exosortase system-associated protein, TIGR04073 family [Mariprofundaceae bacterium]
MKISNNAAIAMLTLGLLVTTPATAQEYATEAGAKFTRGLANTAAGWGEIPKNIANKSRDSNVLVGLTYGTAKGAAHTVGRTIAGVFDVATFLVPSDELVHSTYVWEQPREDTTYGVR